MCRRISRPPTSVHLHRARWDRVIILGKRIGGSLCSLRIEQLRTRCEVGGSWKNMEQATGKMVKKNRWKFRGQKGRLCFAADCSFSFFTPLPSGTIFLFLGLGTWMDLNVLRFGFNLWESLTSTYRSDFRRAMNNNVTTFFFLIKIFSLSLSFCFFISQDIFQESRRRFSGSFRFFKSNPKAVNFNKKKYRDSIRFYKKRSARGINERERDRFYGYKNCAGSCWEVAF